MPGTQKSASFSNYEGLFLKENSPLKWRLTLGGQNRLFYGQEEDRIEGILMMIFQGGIDLEWSRKTERTTRFVIEELDASDLRHTRNNFFIVEDRRTVEELLDDLPTDSLIQRALTTYVRLKKREHVSVAELRALALPLLREGTRYSSIAELMELDPDVGEVVRDLDLALRSEKPQQLEKAFMTFVERQDEGNLLAMDDNLEMQVGFSGGFEGGVIKEEELITGPTVYADEDLFRLREINETARKILGHMALLPST